MLKPDSRRTSYQRAIVEHDYGMVDGVHKVKTRSALVPYVLQQLNLDLSKLEIKPQAQQIVLDNLDQVKQHAF